MIRWDGPDREDSPVEMEWRVSDDGRLEQVPKRSPPEPASVEAHRRTRFFDSESGALVREIHEAVRTTFRRRKAPRLPSGRLKDPPVIVAALLGGVIHGAVWWGLMSVIAFGPSPWWALVPAAAVPILLGFKFLMVHAGVVWIIGSFFLAFDGYLGLTIAFGIAGFFAPGRWIRGEW